MTRFLNIVLTVFSLSWIVFSGGAPTLGAACSDDPPSCVAACNAVHNPRIAAANEVLEGLRRELQEISSQLEDLNRLHANELARNASILAGINAALIVAVERCTTPQCIAAALGVANAAVLVEGARFNEATIRLDAQLRALRLRYESLLPRIVQAQEALIEALNALQTCLRGCVPCPPVEP